MWVPIVNRADVLFEGLASGMIGTCQIDFRLPVAIQGLERLTRLTGDPAPGKLFTGYLPIQAAAN